MMAAHRTTKMALAVSAALAITLTTACTKDTPKPVQTVAPTPTVTATPTPTYSSRQQEAINSIQKFDDMFEKVANNRTMVGKDLNQMYEVSRGTASEGAIYVIEQEYWKKNIHTVGRSKFNILGVEQGSNDHEWIVTTCVDPSAVKVFDATNKDITPPRDKGSKMVYTTELDKKNGKWFVITREFKGLQSC